MNTRALVMAGGVVGLGYIAWQMMQGNGNVQVTSPLDLSGSGGSGNVDTSTIEGYLQASGLTPNQASGVAAGIYAESQGNPNAVNPTSGAFGIGQWLGSRQAALFNLYGPNPTLSQQLDFLVSELQGGDPGGSAVLSQSDPLSTLVAYITKFMRPAPGAQTTGDIARGTAYLG